MDWNSRRSLCTAKPSRYPVNGEGRDTYIERNNGGLFKGYEPSPAMSVGSLREIIPPESKLCHMLQKRVQYFSNGTGRDSYIK